jgi:NAD(P)-dependent dehydrogenase (short-subunit alcohol dehydrogenase family)
MSKAGSDLTGRIVVLTGATSGIGLETARALASARATLALVSRDRSKSDEVVRRLRAESGNPLVEGHVADLSSLAEVRRVSGELLDRYPAIHVLVNNAGALYTRREETVEGIERTWALNVLAPFLLTHLLLDRMIASAPARVVNVASTAHARGRLNLADPEGKARYSGFGAYSQSKLALVMETYELARRLDGTGVTANSLHPGFVATRWGRNNRGLASALLGGAMALFAISAKKGARTSVYLASSPEVAGVTGRYFARERAVASSARSHLPQDARALWAILCAQTGVSPQAPRVERPRP